MCQECGIHCEYVPVGLEGAVLCSRCGSNYGTEWRKAHWTEILEAAGVPKQYATRVPSSMTLPGALVAWRGDPWAVTIGGKIGCGKTWLAVRLLGEMACEDMSLNPAKDFYFCDASVAVEGLRREIASDTDGKIADRLLESKVLVLDDFGAERSTDFARDRLGMVLRTRYNNLAATILTTNAMDLSPIRELDPRIASRLREGLMVSMKGEDRRTKPVPLGPRAVTETV